MADLSGFPSFEIQFDKEGKPFNPADEQQLLAFLGQGTVTDLFIISHGWNNDMAEARALYQNFFARVREVIDASSVPGVAARKFAVCGVLWPSKKFADKELIPSGAASAAASVTDKFLKARLDDLRGVFDHPKADELLAQARKLVPKLDQDAQARQQFADLLRQLPNRTATHPDDASDRFFSLSGDEVMKRLSKPVVTVKPGAAGGAASAGHATGTTGAAAGLGQLFSGAKAGADRLLNFLTYYQMKERAGAVGRNGVNALVRRIRAQAPNLKLHLIGHSFGGRLVTATTLGPDGQPPVKVNTLTLLQAAFSHNGFGAKFDGKHDGFFRRVVASGQVTGPTLITCTKNDTAVGIAYPLASLLAGQNAAALGDANDQFGGIGRNGAQHTPEAINGTLGAVGTSYQFQGGRLYNLNADTLIKDHSDICHKEVAYALLTAVAAT
jgi:hypothetical protein